MKYQVKRNGKVVDFGRRGDTFSTLDEAHACVGYHRSTDQYAAYLGNIQQRSADSVKYEIVELADVEGWEEKFRDASGVIRMDWIAEAME